MQPAKLLISREEYLASGIHIGMKQRTKQMQEFIYKIRPDGLAVLNLKMIDEKIRVAAKFLARQQKILIVTRKTIAQDIVKKFAEVVGAEVVTGRFMPGMLTNPQYKKFYEADVVFVVDPLTDYQAMKEAVSAQMNTLKISEAGKRPVLQRFLDVEIGVGKLVDHISMDERCIQMGTL